MKFSLGNCRVWKGNGAKRRCVSREDCVMYVPILQTLQMLLNNKFIAVLSEVCLLSDVLCFIYFDIYRLKKGMQTHLEFSVIIVMEGVLQPIPFFQYAIMLYKYSYISMTWNCVIL